MSANPSGATQQALAREAMTIGEELQRYGQGGNFEFRMREVAQPLDLLRVIREVKPTVIHFAWYRGSRDVGDPIHGLHFRGPDGELKPVSPRTFGEMLYLEFAWHRSGTYRREIDRVKAGIDWFTGMVRNRFR